MGILILQCSRGLGGSCHSELLLVVLIPAIPSAATVIHSFQAAAHTDQFCLNTEIRTFEGNALGRGEDTDQSSLSDRNQDI